MAEAQDVNDDGVRDVEEDEDDSTYDPADMPGNHASVAEASAVLEVWKTEFRSENYDPKPTLLRLSELVEKELEIFYATDPDPLDDRHPNRINPLSAYGQLLKVVPESDQFMTKLCGSYMASRDDPELSVLSARLMVNVVEGVDLDTISQDHDDLMDLFFGWASGNDEPLRSLAFALLGNAMELTDVAAAHRENNVRLIPVAIARLKELSASDDVAVGSNRNIASSSSTSPTDFAELIGGTSTLQANGQSESKKRKSAPGSSSSSKRQKLADGECSSSSTWADLVPLLRGESISYPLTPRMCQRLVLRYLAPLAEYQEFLSFALDNSSAVKLLKGQLNFSAHRDIRLVLSGLSYLASLLEHKKFAGEFISAGGLAWLLAIPRRSLAAPGVAVCLYYISCADDVFERVFASPEAIRMEMLDAVFWLLEHSYDSAKSHALLFLANAFAFRVTVDVFDTNDGLRRLLNMISTQPILQLEGLPGEIVLSEDDIAQCRQKIKNAVDALVSYFETQLFLRIEHLKRTNPKLLYTSKAQLHVATIAANKPIKVDSSLKEAYVSFLLECLPLRMPWRPVDEMMKLGGISLLLRLAAVAADWTFFAGRTSVVAGCCEALWYCTTLANVQSQLCSQVKLPAGDAVGMNILLGLCEGDELSDDTSVQRTALEVIINCVTGPTVKILPPLRTHESVSERPDAASLTPVTPTPAKKKSAFAVPDLLEKMWECVRANNGIMVLKNLVMIKQPVFAADALRALGCRALDGLARCPIVRQIISMMPLFRHNVLRSLMLEPILHDKRAEHQKFCQYARSLFERVTGTPYNPNESYEIERIRRANIVAQTRIRYSRVELLQLIHHHLKSEGFHRAASSLQDEASLPICAASELQAPLKKLPGPNLPSTHPAGAFSAVPSSPAHSNRSRHLLGVISSLIMSAQQQNNSLLLLPAAASRQTQPPPAGSLAPPLGGSLAPPVGGSVLAPANQGSAIPGGGTPVPPVVPVTPHSGIVGTPKTIRFRPLATPLTSAGRLPKERLPPIPITPKPEVRPFQPEMSLDAICTEFFRKQHATCRNPSVVCPTFSFVYHHKCPEPRLKNKAPANIVQRQQCRSIFPSFGGDDGLRCDIRYVYSRFKPVRILKDAYNDQIFTCGCFTPRNDHLLLGTYSGDLKVYEVDTATDVTAQSCHATGITHVEPSRDGSLVLTSSAFLKPYSALWSLDQDNFTFNLKYHLAEENLVEFCRSTQNRLIATRGLEARVYDLETARCIVQLYDPDKANNYANNRATSHPIDDNMMLSDGLLWDIRGGAGGGCLIHKFDKLNPNISGVFHPRGLEVIINTEVWDIRKFRLLHTVPALDQSRVTFNASKDVIFGAIHRQTDDNDEMNETHIRRFLGSSFRTIDATDYSLIATTDVRRNILDLCIDSDDRHLALIENQGFADDMLSLEENVCRLYEVGVVRSEEEQDSAVEDVEGDEDDEDDEDDDELSLADEMLGHFEGREDEEDEMQEEDWNAGDAVEMMEGELSEDFETDDDTSESVVSVSDLSNL